MGKSIIEKAAAKSEELGYRVGRDWLIEEGATHAEAYQIMYELAMQGIPYRYAGQDTLLGKKAERYLTEEQVENIRSLYDDRPTEVDLAAPPVTIVPAAAADDSPDGVSLSRIRTALSSGLNPRVVGELTAKELMADAEKLGQFASRAHATLGAYLVYIEGAATPDDFAAAGFTSMKSWIEERVPVGYSVALKLMQVARVFMERGGISPAELEKVSYTRLYAAVNLAQEKGADYAFEMAKTRTVKELQSRLFDPNPNTGAKGTAADDEEAREKQAKAKTIVTTGDEAFVYLDEERYPLSLVQLWEQQKERAFAALRKSDVTPTPMNALSLVVSLLSGMGDDEFEGEAGYMK